MSDVERQCGCVADHGQASTGTGQGHVEPTPVTQEADGGLGIDQRVGAHSREDDDLLLPALEPVHRRHLDGSPCGGAVVEGLLDGPHLRSVGRDHADVARHHRPAAAGAGGLEQVPDDGHDDVHLGLVEVGLAVPCDINMIEK